MTILMMRTLVGASIVGVFVPFVEPKPNDHPRGVGDEEEKRKKEAPELANGRLSTCKRVGRKNVISILIN